MQRLSTDSRFACSIPWADQSGGGRLTFRLSFRLSRAAPRTRVLARPARRLELKINPTAVVGSGEEGSFSDQL
jgi:hypothetical protein